MAIFSLRRIVHRAMRAASERRIDRIADVNGFEQRPGTTDRATLYDVFINEPYGYEVDFAVDFVIEIGANVGYATAYLAQRFPEARIIAVEAESENYQQLVKNTARHAGIVPVHAAVGATDGETFVHRGGGEWGFYTSNQAGQTSAERVERVSIPTLMKRYGIEATHDVLMKVNIVGFEEQLFDATSTRWIGALRQFSVKVPSPMDASNRLALFRAMSDESLPPLSMEVYKNSLVFRRMQ